MATLLEFFGINIETLGKTGVYSIYHTYDTTKLYIGSTSKLKSNDGRNTHHGFYKRFYDHIRNLKNNKHHCKHLQNVVNKYGIEGVVFEVVEICEDCAKSFIFEREQYYIDKLKPVYNCFKTVHPQGRIWTEQEKENLKEKMKGVKFPDFVYEKLRKPIYQFDLSGNLLKKFSSKAEASKILKIDAASISNCALGKRKTAGGYTWSYQHPKEAREMNLSGSKLT